MDRAPVSVPLETGIKVVDALIPIGRGQRELILGDRQTGKSAIAIDTILHQRDQDVICVYCAIGQRSAAVANLLAELKRHGALDYSVVVVASGEESPGLQYIAPYAATSIAEFFMEEGRDVLVVYDDLTRTPRPTASSRCCCAGRPAARRSPATSSTSTRACSSARRICGRSSAAGR
jgi:F-type H+/Na+-transporting ATPase subunit alpha